MSFGERLADKVAAVGGSWTFIIGFGVFLIGWTGLNVVVLSARAFDPYPFVFLNLILSMIAALQAPIIMMSQGRAAVKDRINARLDYEINLQAEMEIADIRRILDERGDEVRASLAEIRTALRELRGDA